MSGGHFDYQQYRLNDIADSIEKLTDQDEWGDEVGNHYPFDVIWRFKEAVKILRRGAKMAQRIDWLVSGDDSIETFRERWKKEVEE